MECVTSRCTVWTDEENNFLRKNYKTISDREIGEVLDRTRVAVTNQRYKLGLTIRSKATTLYLACTPDRYELPVFVTDDLDEMEEFTGYPVSSIRSLISRPATTTERSYGYIFRKVRIKKTKGE